MAVVILSKEHATEVQVGDDTFALWEGDDGGLYIELSGKGALSVTVSDYDETEVAATGLWLTVQPQK